MLPIFTRWIANANSHLLFGIWLFSFTLVLPQGEQCVAQGSTSRFLKELQGLGPEGKNHKELISTLPDLSDANGEDGLKLLKAMDDQKPLQANWLRLSAQSIFERDPPETSSLRSIVMNEESSDLSRVAAFESLREIAPVQADALVPSFQKDACLPLRRICIEQKLKTIENSAVSDDQKTAELRRLLTDVRDIDQADNTLRLLRNLGVEIDRNKWLGFILNWHVIGPFDNTAGKGFAAVYPIEQQTQSPQFNKNWPGKHEKVAWQEISSADPKGFVDINNLVAKHNGAVVYLAKNIQADADRSVQLRLGTYNAVKAWANGKQILAREVYHNNEMVDQFVADFALKPGDNWIVIKLCQNEQEENWAQNWRFLCRVTDESGKTISWDQ